MKYILNILLMILYIKYRFLRFPIEFGIRPVSLLLFKPLLL